MTAVSTPIAVGAQPQGTEAASVRYDRPTLVGFVADARSEAALREGLGEVLAEQVDLRRGGVRNAIAAMQKQATPRVLLVDVTGEEDPLSALGELAQVVEPDVCVLVIGEINNMDFYREITRGMGAAEYLTKPFTRDIVARHFAGFLDGRTPSGSTLGRRGVAITGTRGGVGATTIAVNLAWHLGVTMRRHTVLLDPDVQFGTAALLLNEQPGSGLRQALEAPERIDAVLAERAAVQASDRLHVLASEEKLNTPFTPAPHAAEMLIGALRKRYNFIVCDVPSAPIPLYRELLDVVDQRVLVMEPTLPAVRDTLRLLALPAGANQKQRPIIVLNRNGLPGALTRRQVEDTLKMKIDVVIPDLPRQVGSATTMGEPAVGTSSSFRAGIVEIARQVAATDLLGSADVAPQGARGTGRKWNFSLFGARK